MNVSFTLDDIYRLNDSSESFPYELALQAILFPGWDGYNPDLIAQDPSFSFLHYSEENEKYDAACTEVFQTGLKDWIAIVSPQAGNYLQTCQAVIAR